MIFSRQAGRLFGMSLLRMVSSYPPTNSPPQSPASQAGCEVQPGKNAQRDEILAGRFNDNENHKDQGKNRNVSFYQVGAWIRKCHAYKK